MSAHGKDAAFNGSKWNLYLEWRLLHRRDLTNRGSALLDAIARMLLGYRKSRGEIGRRILMEMTDIGDARDFNKVRDELIRLGLGVEHDGKGVATRTIYDLGAMLSEALQASEDRRFHSRRPRSQSTAHQPSITTVVQPSITTAPEPPRIETTSSRREALTGLPSSDSFGVGEELPATREATTAPRGSSEIRHSEISTPIATNDSVASDGCSAAPTDDGAAVSLPWSTGVAPSPSDEPPGLRWLQTVIGSDYYAPEYRIQSFRELMAEWDAVDAKAVDEAMS